jgi:carbonic anhydrase/acetyltransferase-like protein (isoleucine patch superfamily)
MIPLTRWAVRTHDTAWVASNATVVGSVTIGPESSVWYTSVLRGDGDSVWIGARTNLQDGTVIHTDPGFPVRLGNRVSVGHRAVLHGCTVADDVLIGMSAVLMNGVQIGEGSLIGAGALLPEGMNVPPRSVVLGMPAKIRREVSADESNYIRRASSLYVDLATLHREHQSSEGG